MSNTLVPLDRLAEVEHLTAALTDQILDAQIINRPISNDQVQALAKAARPLHDSGIPLAADAGTGTQRLGAGSN